MSSTLWVQWDNNGSKRHDRTISGVPRKTLVSPSAEYSVGDAVDVWWGTEKARKSWHGFVAEHGGLTKPKKTDKQVLTNCLESCTSVYI